MAEVAPRRSTRSRSSGAVAGHVRAYGGAYAQVPDRGVGLGTHGIGASGAAGAHAGAHRGSGGTNRDAAHHRGRDVAGGAGGAAMAHKRTEKRRSHSKVPEKDLTPDLVEDRRKRSDGSTKVVQRYVKGRLLGKGGFARCFKFTSVETNRVLAGKVVAKSSLTKSRARQKLLGEIKIHRSLNHPRIVKFETFFEDKYNVYIVLEICPNQSLMEMVRRRKRLTEPEVQYYMLQIIDGVRYCHKRNVIHRDLKLGNLFIARDMSVKLGDFGLAAQLTHSTERKRTVCGTPNYIAPEILENKDGHSFEVDTWSLGVIMYTMLVGKPPFETKDVKATYRRIKANNYEFPKHVSVSEHAKSLIRWVLNTSPAMRPSLDDMVRHSFFTNKNSFIPKSVPTSALTIAPRFATEDVVHGQIAIAQHLREAAAMVAKLHAEADSKRAASSSKHKAGSGTARGAAAEAATKSLSQNKVAAAAASAAAAAAAASKAMGDAADIENADRVDRRTSQAKAAVGKAKVHRSSSAASSASTKAVSADVVPRLPFAPMTNTGADATGSSSARVAQAPSAASSRHTSSLASGRRPSSEKAVAGSGSSSLRRQALERKQAWGDAPVGGEAKPLRSGSASTGSDDGSRGRSSGLTRSSTAHADLQTADLYPTKTVVHARPASARAASMDLKLKGAVPAEVPASSRLSPSAAHVSGSLASSGGTGIGSTHGVGAPPNLAGSGRDSAMAATASVATASPSVPESSGGASAAFATSSPAMPPSPPAASKPAKEHKRAQGKSVPVVPAPSGPATVGKSAARATSSKPGHSGAAAAASSRTSAAAASGGAEIDTLRNMHAQLTRSFAPPEATTTTHSEVSAPPATAAAEPWVTTWVDYTSKYGLGYLLSNGAVGVYFNDSTKIVLASDGEHFEYVERSTTDPKSGCRIEAPRQPYLLSAAPSSLNKKVTLLKHFRSYLLEQYNKRTSPPAEERLAMAAGSSSSDMVFVKKWVRTRHAVLFRLSNRTVQVNFFDHTSIVLSSEARIVTYTNKHSVRSTHALSTEMTGSRPDIAKRLKYTKDILYQLITGARR